MKSLLIMQIRWTCKLIETCKDTKTLWLILRAKFLQNKNTVFLYAWNLAKYRYWQNYISMTTVCQFFSLMSCYQYIGKKIIIQRNQKREYLEKNGWLLVWWIYVTASTYMYLIQIQLMIPSWHIWFISLSPK